MAIGAPGMTISPQPCCLKDRRRGRLLVGVTIHLLLYVAHHSAPELLVRRQALLRNGRLPRQKFCPVGVP